MAGQHKPWFAAFLGCRLPKSQAWFLHACQLWWKMVFFDFSSPHLSYCSNSINLEGLLHWLNEIMEMKLIVLCPQQAAAMNAVGLWLPNGSSVPRHLCSPTSASLQGPPTTLWVVPFQRYPVGHKPRLTLLAFLPPLVATSLVRLLSALASTFITALLRGF